jgi:hypothetical protein
MYHKSLFTLSPEITSGIKNAIKYLFIALFLAAIIIVSARIIQPTSNATVNSNPAVLASNPASSALTVDNSLQAHGTGRDFGAIYGSVDPGSNLRAEPANASLAAHLLGHDFGAIYGSVDPGGSISADPVNASVAVRLPGHDFGTIYGNVDPGVRQRTDPPPFVYWSNGQMVVRRSELGPLTDPVSNPVAETVVNPSRVLGPGRDFGAIYGTVDPSSSLTADPVVSSMPFHGPGHDFGAIYGDIDPGKK